MDALQRVMSNSTKVMVDVEGGNNILYLPLDKIARQSEEGISVPSTGPSSSNTTSIRDLTDRVIEEIRKRNRQ